MYVIQDVIIDLHKSLSSFFFLGEVTIKSLFSSSSFNFHFSFFGAVKM